jgi:hypothetical protein
MTFHNREGPFALSNMAAQLLTRPNQFGLTDRDLGTGEWSPAPSATLVACLLSALNRLLFLFGGDPIGLLQFEHPLQVLFPAVEDAILGLVAEAGPTSPPGAGGAEVSASRIRGRRRTCGGG